MSELISRQAAIDAIVAWTVEDRPDVEMPTDLIDRITGLPSAQPEHLTDDDFETIRIHLSAFKERLCNQRRWKEAEDYERLIDRFISFASAQPEIVRCKECKYWMPHSQLGYDEDNETYHDYCGKLIPEDDYYAFYRDADDYCSRAERKTDEND